MVAPEAGCVAYKPYIPDNSHKELMLRISEHSMCLMPRPRPTPSSRLECLLKRMENHNTDKSHFDW